MGLVDKFKNLVNPIDNDNDYDDSYGFEGDDNADENAGYDNDADFTEEEMQPPPQSAQGGKRQNAGQHDNNVNLSGSTLSLKVVKPDRWENVSQIADHLINGCTVVLNLESTNKELMHRMIDFLSGVIYTIEGDMKNVSRCTWVLTPKNVDMSQEQQSARNIQRQSS